MAVAGFTILAASVVALKAKPEAPAAYSTVSQLCTRAPRPYGAVRSSRGVAIAVPRWQITLFFAAGAIYTAAHKTEVSQLDGIGRRMPWTMAAFAVGTLSMIGLPPAAGFVSKWYMLAGAIADARWAVVAVIAASTLLNAGYFLPIVHRAFFRAPGAHDALHPHGEAPLPIVIALTLTRPDVALFLRPTCRSRWRAECWGSMSPPDRPKAIPVLSSTRRP